MSDQPDNMRLWSTLGKTDPTQTKAFKRAGGFSGTAMKPMWVWQRLTEQFGPCGAGWGMSKPTYQVVPGHNNEVLVYCTVSGWYRDEVDGKLATVYGVGGDKIVTHIKANPKYNREERWENDDEAFKKAFTDALMNAFKFVGVGADVHMGLFDDSKYVAQMAQEFSPPEEKTEPQKRGKPEPLKGPIKTRAALRDACSEFVRELHGAGDRDMLDIVLADNAPLISQVEDEHEYYWKGDGMDFLGLEREIAAAKERVADKQTHYRGESGHIPGYDPAGPEDDNG